MAHEHKKSAKTQCDEVLTEQRVGQDTIIAHGRLLLQQHLLILHYDANVDCDGTAGDARQKIILLNRKEKNCVIYAFHVTTSKIGCFPHTPCLFATNILVNNCQPIDGTAFGAGQKRHTYAHF